MCMESLESSLIEITAVVTSDADSVCLRFACRVEGSETTLQGGVPFRLSEVTLYTVLRIPKWAAAA